VALEHWERRSIALASGEGYFDRVAPVYRFNDPPAPREIDPVKLERLRIAYLAYQENQTPVNARSLFRALTDDGCHENTVPWALPTISSPAVMYFRENSSHLEPEYRVDKTLSNPLTVSSYANSVLNEFPNWESLRLRITAPKSSSKQMSANFREWLRGEFPTITPDEYREQGDAEGIVDAPDSQLKALILEIHGIDIGDKSPDILARFGGTNVVGEAKWANLTGDGLKKTHGQLHDLLRRRSTPQLSRIGIMDGWCWLARSTNAFGKFVYRTTPYRRRNPVMSALLLRPYFRSLGWNGE
jgi:hypothetical protein